MEVISSIYNSGYNIKKFYLGSRELNLAYLGNQVIYDEVIGDNDLNYILYEFYGSDTLPNTVEAPVKRAILKGNTLVNLFEFTEPITVMTDRVRLFSSDNFKNNLLNGTYTIINTSNKKIALDINNKSTGVWEKTVTLLGGQKTSVVFDNAYIRMASFSFSEGWSNDNLEEIKCSLVVLNGEHTNIDIPYFEGMQSVKMPVLTTSDTVLIDNKVALKIDATSNPPGQIALNTVNGDEIQLNNPSSVADVGFNGDCLISGKDVYFSYNYNNKLYACEVVYEQSVVTSGAWGYFVSEANFRVQQAVRSLASTRRGWLETKYPTFEYNQKIHVLFVDDFENKTKSIFLNGVRVGYLGGIPFVDGDFEYATITFLKNITGKIYKFTLYNQPLTDEEIIAIFKQEDKTNKTNILTVNEPIELRGIGDVKDELNLLTGEVTQRIRKIVLDGSQNMDADGQGIFIQVDDMKKVEDYRTIITCDKLPVFYHQWDLPNVENGITGYHDEENKYPGQNWLYIKVNNSIDVDEVRQILTQNPITVQYELSVESIKTVDLTIVDQDGKTINKLNSFNGTTHISTEVAENSAYPMVSLEVASELQAAMSKVTEDIELIKPVQNDIETTIDTQSNDIDSLLLATTELFEMFL